jgi:hypothetical protein
VSDSPAQIPLLIGVTGHRDLVADEQEQLRLAVRRFLVALQERFPDSPVQVVSSLSAGADLLVAEVALAAGIECIAVLPLPLEHYRPDFTTAGEAERFDAALNRCRQHIICPLAADVSLAELAQPGPKRDAQYARAGELIAGAAFILLALWDGRPAVNAAGTAGTVEFRLARRAWLGTVERPAQHELLPNLPPDFVYHIVTSRSGSPPLAGLMPLQEGYRCNSQGPLEAPFPATATLIGLRTSELNQKLRRHAPAIRRHTEEVQLTAELAAPPPNVVAVAQLFGAVDWYAMRMRRCVMRWLYTTSILMVLMGIFFLLYSEPPPDCSLCRYSILVFLGAFLTVLGLNRVAAARHWHRRHLESRALAEGLRVELFWAVAGVAREGMPAPHRELLKQADPGLEWIPNAARVASLMLADVRSTGIAGGVEFAIRRWVGSFNEQSSHSQQLRYYGQASRARGALATLAERVAGVAVIIGVSLAAILAAEEWLGGSRSTEVLLLGIGGFSLLAAVVDALVHKTAERELQRQYSYMHDVFVAAHDRLVAAHSDDERRAILAQLGRAALAEHAAWLHIHRDRPIDRSRLQ